MTLELLLLLMQIYSVCVSRTPPDCKSTDCFFQIGCLSDSTCFVPSLSPNAHVVVNSTEKETQRACEIACGEDARVSITYWQYTVFKPRVSARQPISSARLSFTTTQRASCWAAVPIPPLAAQRPSRYSQRGWPTAPVRWCYQYFLLENVTLSQEGSSNTKQISFKLLFWIICFLKMYIQARSDPRAELGSDHCTSAFYSEDLGLNRSGICNRTRDYILRWSEWITFPKKSWKKDTKLQWSALWALWARFIGCAHLFCVLFVQGRWRIWRARLAWQRHL